MNIIKKIKNKLFSNSNEPKEIYGIIPKKYIKQFLPEKPIIFEAGAHKGIDTIEMAKIFPHGTIYAFEPISEIYKQLKVNTKQLPNVFCFNTALGEKTRKEQMYVSGGSSDGSSSLLKPKEHLIDHPGVTFNKKVEVEVITLKDWAQKNNVDKIDFFWLDLQGSELDVLKTSENLVKKARAIYTEVCTKETYEHQAIYSDLKKWLESLGFEVNKEEMAWVHTGNVLFINRNSSI